jgi:hypothetical protein
LLNSRASKCEMARPVPCFILWRLKIICPASYHSYCAGLRPLIALFHNKTYLHLNL